jgi:hypothetical protein
MWQIIVPWSSLRYETKPAVDEHVLSARAYRDFLDPVLKSLLLHGPMDRPLQCKKTAIQSMALMSEQASHSKKELKDIFS